MPQADASKQTMTATATPQVQSAESPVVSAPTKHISFHHKQVWPSLAAASGHVFGRSLQATLRRNTSYLPKTDRLCCFVPQITGLKSVTSMHRHCRACYRRGVFTQLSETSQRIVVCWHLHVSFSPRQMVIGEPADMVVPERAMHAQ